MAEQGFFGSLAGTMQSPLFLGGLGLLSGGGMQGMSQGMQSGILAQKNTREDEQYQRQRDQQAQRDAMLAQWSQSPPEWAKGLPAGILDVARMGGGDQAPQILGGVLAKHPEMMLERQKMGLQNQLTSAQIQHMRNLDQLEREKLKAEQEFNGMMFGNKPSTPPQVAKPQVPMTPPAGMSIQPPSPIQPMGFQQGGAQPQFSDPNIMRVADGPAQPQGQQQPATNLIMTPFGAMPLERAQQMVGPLLIKKPAAGKAMQEAINDAMGKLGKEGENQNDKAALNVIEQVSRLDSIKSKYKPEYQTYETAAKNYANSWLDSFEATRNMVPAEERTRMAEYTQYRQDAMNNLSAYIKEITGAAMGVQEEKRIREGMPDPKSDSPAQFEAKLNNAIATAKLALARHSYLKSNGYDAGSIAALAKADKLSTVHSLDDMKSMINSRLSQAEKQIMASNPGLDQKAVDMQLRQIQRKEFGI